MRQFSILSALILLFSIQASAQSAKKYILLEQFSNTYCSICANRIPQFRSNLEGFEADYHLISFFAPSPYPACIYYNANKPDNDARIAFYNVPGTPTVYVNGQRVNQGNSIVPVSVLEDLSDEVSPIQLVVNKTDNGNNIDVDVSVISHGDVIGAGIYVLQVAVVESLVIGGPQPNYQQHHNVMRTMLTPDVGAPFTPANAGEQVDYGFTFQAESGWNAANLHVIAFVQEVSSKDVLNSGSDLDPVATSVREIEKIDFSISPNPANDFLRVQTSNFAEILDFQIYDTQSRIIQSGRLSGDLIDISKIPAGQYWLSLRTQAKTGVMSFIKTH